MASEASVRHRKRRWHGAASPRRTDMPGRTRRHAHSAAGDGGTWQHGAARKSGASATGIMMMMMMTMIVVRCRSRIESQRWWADVQLGSYLDVDLEFLRFPQRPLGRPCRTASSALLMSFAFLECADCAFLFPKTVRRMASTDQRHPHSHSHSQVRLQWHPFSAFP